MKKRNIFAVLATLAAALLLFAACGGNDQQEEPSTVIGADGQVYEEVTEIVTEIVTEVVSELKTEIVTEIKTEPKTDKKGEAVTNNKGVTEVVTEIITEVVSEVVTEIKTEVVTEVVTVTIPYEPPTEESEDDTTSDESSSAAENATGSAEDASETFPEGERVDVPLNADGSPKEPLMKRIMDSAAKSKQFYMDCEALSNNGDLTLDQGVPYKLYMSGNNMAMEFSYSGLVMRTVVKDGKLAIIFPKAKTYYQVGSEEDVDLGEVDMAIWETIGSTEMNYVATESLNVDGSTWTCEIYEDSGNTNKYFFDARQQLKRIEVIPAEGEVVIFKINSYSTKVDDSIFDIPKGCTPITEEALQKMMESLQLQ